MNVLVINCGSSSLKFQLINAQSEEVLAKGICERIGIDGRLTYQPEGGEKEKSDKAMPTHTEAIQFVIEALSNPETRVVKSLDEIQAVGHRVVHGGEKFASSVVITEEVKKAIEECNDLAPLHNPANLIGIEACEKLMPGTPMVAVFDTAFHQTMPEKAYMYGLPYEYYKNYCKEFLIALGIKEAHLRLREHDKEELSHYSTGTSDIEYLFSFGWGEIWGIADRTDFDLRCHQETSKQNLEYRDPLTNESFLPYCIEPSVGVERLFLAFLCDAYEEEQLEKDTPIVLHLHPALAPVKAAVLPLSKQLSEKAMEVFHLISGIGNCEFDETQNIGKRYRRQDAIGTPFCVTVDFETEKDGCVTVRERDSMKQERIPLTELKSYLEAKIAF